MSPRIEVAELTSFRLKLPRQVLERLPAQHHGVLALSLTREDGELVLADAEADSFLRFRPIGEDAILTDAALLNDPRGRFFQLLGSLLVRHGGDLEAQLVWNDEERNDDDGWTGVRVVRGQTTFPGFAVQVAQNRLSQAPAPEALFGAAGGGAGGGSGGGGSDGAVPPGTEDEAAEVARLLLRAEQAWAEYQRLKAQRQDGKR